MRNQRWPWLAAVIAGTILFALDLPYILLACHAGFCNSYPFDPLILAFILTKGIVAGSLLGWMSVAVYEAVRRTFLVGVVAICLEGSASAGLVYLQFLHGAPNESDIASIPLDIVAGIVSDVCVGVALGGLPAMLSAYLRLRLSGDHGGT